MVEREKVLKEWNTSRKIQRQKDSQKARKIKHKGNQSTELTAKRVIRVTSNYERLNF